MNLNEIKKNFYSKFENPSNSEPYDTHEGGWLNENLFIDTEDAVAEIECPENIKSKLIENLNKGSTKWVRK